MYGGDGLNGQKHKKIKSNDNATKCPRCSAHEANACVFKQTQQGKHNDDMVVIKLRDKTKIQIIN